jgi:hypothetical protein
MAFTANVFTPTIIADTLYNYENLFATNRMTELAQEIVAGQAILTWQDPNIIPIGNGTDCFSADIYTLRSGSFDKGNKTIACAVGTGPKAGSEKITPSKVSLVNHEIFSVDDGLCQNAIEFSTLLSYGFAKAMAGLETKLSKALVALAATGADTPTAAYFETTGAVVGDAYEIAAANFDSDVLADLQWAGKSEDWIMPLIVNGRNFFNKAILEQYASSGCCTNDAILNRNQVFDIVWDAKNVDSVLGSGSTLVIDKNALYFWSSPAYSNIGMQTMMNEGKEAADRYHFVTTLPRLQYFANGGFQPIYVDVRMERACIATGLVPRDGWKVECMLHGAMGLNLPNESGKQGIYRINKV